MHQLEAIRQPGRLERIARGHQIGRAQPEFRIFTAAGRPFAGSLGSQTHPHPDHRLDADLLGNGQDLEKLLEFFNHQNHLFAQLTAQQRVLDEERILVTVADDQRIGILVNGQRREQLRFASRFDPEMVRRAGVHDLLDHLAQLIDLDGENAAVNVLVGRLLDRSDERLVDRLHPVPQQILKPDHHWKCEPVFGTRLRDQLHDIDRRRRILRRANRNITAVVDRKVSEAPTVDIVERDGGRNVPRLLHGGRNMEVQAPVSRVDT